MRVWHAVTATRIGSIFFLKKVSSERYSGQILVSLFEDLNVEKNEHTFSQQDSAGSCPYSQ